VICSLTEHANLKIVDVKMVPKNIIGRTAAALRGRSRILWGLKLIKIFGAIVKKKNTRS
jgi:hypothetical protein